MDTQQEEALRILQRPINCLLDEDRNTRRSGLSAISEWVESAKEKNLVPAIFQKFMLRNICRCLQDKIQKNRQISYQILERVLPLSTHLSSDTVSSLLKVIFARLDKKPFPQTSEELRMAGVLITLQLLQSNHYEFVPMVGEYCHMLSTILKDQNPEMKKFLPTLLKKTSSLLKNRIGPYVGNIIRSLNDNITFQQNKVRKVSIEAVSPLLLSQGAGSHFQLVKGLLGLSIFDKIRDVRLVTFQALGQLLKGLSIVYLKNCQDAIVSMLLGGLSDQCEQIREKVMTILEQGGRSKQQLKAQEQSSQEVSATAV